MSRFIDRAVMPVLLIAAIALVFVAMGVLISQMFRGFDPERLWAMLRELGFLVSPLIYGIAAFFMFFVFRRSRETYRLRIDSLELQRDMLHHTIDTMQRELENQQELLLRFHGRSVLPPSINIPNLRTLYEDDPVIMALLDAIDPDSDDEDDDPCP